MTWEYYVPVGGSQYRPMNLKALHPDRIAQNIEKELTIDFDLRKL